MGDDAVGVRCEGRVNGNGQVLFKDARVAVSYIVLVKTTPLSILRHFRINIIHADYQFGAVYSSVPCSITKWSGSTNYSMEQYAEWSGLTARLPEDSIIW